MLSIKVPPLGESIVEATVSRWLKKEGEAVASGDTLVELETDKITVEVPAPRAGVLVKRSVSEGDVVKVGDVLCRARRDGVWGCGVGSCAGTRRAGPICFRRSVNTDTRSGSTGTGRENCERSFGRSIGGRQYQIIPRCPSCRNGSWNRCRFCDRHRTRRCREQARRAREGSFGATANRSRTCCS